MSVPIIDVLEMIEVDCADDDVGGLDGSGTRRVRGDRVNLIVNPLAEAVSIPEPGQRIRGGCKLQCLGLGCNQALQLHTPCAKRANPPLNGNDEQAQARQPERDHGRCTPIPWRDHGDRGRGEPARRASRIACLHLEEQAPGRQIGEIPADLVAPLAPLLGAAFMANP